MARKSQEYFKQSSPVISKFPIPVMESILFELSKCRDLSPEILLKLGHADKLRNLKYLTMDQSDKNQTIWRLIKFHSSEFFTIGATYNCLEGSMVV